MLYRTVIEHENERPCSRVQSLLGRFLSLLIQPHFEAIHKLMNDFHARISIASKLETNSEKEEGGGVKGKTSRETRKPLKAQIMLPRLYEV